ncbi:MAG: hypothetical protein QXK94_02970 [Candidatus Jordarchaeales archaeon]
MLVAENVTRIVGMLREELRVLGAITARGIALYSVGGKKIYSDLDPAVEERLRVFVPSFPGLSVGSHITVNIGERNLVIMRLSERAVLAVFTHQRVGIVLVKMGALIKSYGSTLDKVLEGVVEEEVPTVQLPPVEEKAEAAEAVEEVVEEVKAVEEAKVAEEVKVEAPPAPAAAEGARGGLKVVTVQVPVILDASIIEKSSGRERKILELCDGEKSVDEIAKAAGVPFFEVLQLCTKYSAKKKIRLLDRPRVVQG